MHAATMLVQKFIALLVTLCLITDQATGQHREEDSSENLSCPVWTTQHNTTCTCNDNVNDIVKCSTSDSVSPQVQLLACYCMTTSDKLNTTVGNCLYSCDRKYYHDITTRNVSNLNNETCGRLNRTGQLCGKCIENNSPPVYSYTSCCINCEDGKQFQNWLKYIAIAFIPLTLFYSGVIAFRLSATSAKLNGFILVSQMISTPGQLRYIYSLHDDKSTTTCDKIHPNRDDIIRRVLVAIYAIWNLDFFRSLYRPFCTQANLSPLTVISLDYIVAVYPMCLVVLTYIWVELKDRLFSVNKLTRPLLKCCARFRGQWNIRTSLIDAFATFILLSYVKILNVSFDLLTPTVLYGTSGKIITRRFLYYDGTVEMFRGDHIFYTIVAISMMTVFNFIPLLILFLYPCRWIHKIPNCLHMHSQTLHTFMDSFQGCFKIKPYDCRYFAAFYLVLRIANLVLFTITLNRFYYPSASFLFMCAAVLVAIVRPYKSRAANLLDTVLLLVTAIAYMSIGVYCLTPGKIYNRTFVVLCSLMVPIPLLYGLGMLMYKVVPRQCDEKIREYVQKMKIQVKSHYSVTSEEAPLLRYTVDL